MQKKQALPLVSICAGILECQFDQTIQQRSKGDAGCRCGLRKQAGLRHAGNGVGFEKVELAPGYDHVSTAIATATQGLVSPLGVRLSLFSQIHGQSGRTDLLGGARGVLGCIVEESVVGAWDG